MAEITIPDTAPRRDYTAAVGQTVFTYDFPIFEDTDLVVLNDGAMQTLGTDYTVTDAGVQEGGTVVFTVAMAGGEEITVYSDIPVERSTDYAENSKLPAATLNLDFDRIVRMIQQTDVSLGRSIRLDDADPTLASEMLLPNATTRADKYLQFDSNGAVTMAAVLDGSETISNTTVGEALYGLQSAEEALAGVTPSNPEAGPELNVLRYGADPTGTNDSYAAFQNANLVSQQYDQARITVPEGTFRIDTTLTIDIDTTSLYGEGQPTLDFSNLAAGEAIALTGSAVSPNQTTTSKGGVYNFKFIGPGSGSGFDLFELGGAAAEAGAHRCQLYNIRGSAFRYGIRIVGPNAYLLRCRDVWIRDVVDHVWVDPAVANSGESMVFEDCVFGEGGGFDLTNATQGEYIVRGGSFDGTDYVVKTNTQIQFENVHFEGVGATGWQETPFQSLTGARALIQIDNGLLLDNSTASNFDNIFSTTKAATAGPGLMISGLVMIGITPNNEIIDTASTGQIIARNIGRGATEAVVGKVWGSALNALADGGFESSLTIAENLPTVVLEDTFQDLIVAKDNTSTTISSDAVVFDTGSRSLKGVVGAAANKRVYILVPVVHGQEPYFTLRFRATTTGADFFIEEGWLRAELVEDTAGLRKLIRFREDALGAAITVNQGASAWETVASVRTNNSKAPPWADYYYVSILGAVNPSTWNVDNVVMTVV